MRLSLALLLPIFVSGAVFAERQPFEHYQSIVDRQMFGEPPDGFDPTKPPSEAVSSRAAQKAEQQLSKEQEKIKSAIRFSMINVTPSGETAVGFTDSGDSKSPANYYLKVGERSGDGKWTVKEADPAKSSMTIVSSDGIEVSLEIGGDSSKGAGKTASAGGDRSSRELVRASQDGRSPSLRAKRNQRLNERQAQSAKMMDDIKKMMDEQKVAEEKRREEDAVRREEEKAAHEAEREAQKAQLQDLKDQLTREREERKRAEEAKAESVDQEPERNSDNSQEE